jgi:hypothetical protein
MILQRTRYRFARYVHLIAPDNDDGPGVHPLRPSAEHGVAHAGRLLLERERGGQAVNGRSRRSRRAHGVEVSRRDNNVDAIHQSRELPAQQAPYRIAGGDRREQLRPAQSESGTAPSGGDDRTGAHPARGLHVTLASIRVCPAATDDPCCRPAGVHRWHEIGPQRGGVRPYPSRTAAPAGPWARNRGSVGFPRSASKASTTARPQ